MVKQAAYNHCWLCFPAQSYGCTQSPHNNRCVVLFYYTGIAVTACGVHVVSDDVS